MLVYQIVLIAKRSRFHAGTRYLTRGINPNVKSSCIHSGNLIGFCGKFRRNRANSHRPKQRSSG